MTKPLILISSARKPLAASEGQMQSTTTGCNTQYVESVVAACGAPLILPCMADKAAIAAAVGAAQGLLLTGGSADIASLAYGQQPHPKTTSPDSLRDDTEIETVRLALLRGLPILGICRGLQLLNVALGGTLIQDIPSQVKDAFYHVEQPGAPTRTHTVDVEEGSLLAKILGCTTFAVNSYHHQAADQIGKGLRVNAHASDGVVEGLESSEGKPILAVQFHPEEMAVSDPTFLSLFTWLVREAAGEQ